MVNSLEHMKPANAAFAIAFLAYVINAQAFNVTVSSQTLLTSNLTIPANASIYSPLPISFNITNTGTSAFNDIRVDININGPTSAATSFYTMPLSPGQKESVLVYLPNATSELGTYYAYVNASYFSNGTRYRGGSATQYSVIYTEYGIRPKGVPDISTLPGLNLTYLPYVNYVSQNGSLSTNLGMENLDVNAIFANVSVPSRFSSLLTFSTQTLYILPNQTVLSNILFKPLQGQPPGTYIIPIIITQLGASHLSSSTQTEYLYFYTFNDSATAPTIFNQLYLTNNTQSAEGTVQVRAPGGSGLTDTIVKLMFNSSLTPSVSQISAFGEAENVTQQGSSYVLQWHIGTLPQGQTKYLYYSVKGITNISALKGAELVLLSSTPVNDQNVFRLLNTTLPAFYTNTYGNVSVDILYTGTSAGSATVSLSGPIGSHITNASQRATALPNQVISKEFGVNMGNYTGTEFLTLSVSSGGVSATYSLPVIVLQKPASVTGVLSTQVPLFKYIIPTVIVIAGIVIFLRSRPSERRQYYRPDMARKLINMREQIKNYQGKD